MVRPRILASKPGWLLGLLGGHVATLLCSALLYLAPTAGLPFVDLPRLVGGLFVGDAGAAFWLGYGILFIGGVFIFPSLLVASWSALPGRPVGFGGPLLKGTAAGVLLWIVVGLLLPLLGVVNQIDALANPGLLGFALGWSVGIGLLLTFLAYAVALALVAAMGQGINPVETIGWIGYRHGDTEQTILSAFFDDDRAIPPHVGGSETGKRT